MASSCISFIGQNILAPMVKVGTLPMRLLALEYGADIVYCEELIDHKLIKSKRVYNAILNTVDFVDESDGSIIFRTCPTEHEHVVLQMGTCCPDRALKVAKLVEGDIAGIDVNMGCPKEFSLKGGMGAALLSQPEKIRAILSNLTSNIKKPITCKIRILDNLSETLKLCKIIESCGVSALAVHGRTIKERPQHRNHNDVIKEISQHVSIPVVANGGSKEIDSYSDINKFLNETGASSVMIARAAEWNCSIFRKEGKLELDAVISAFLKKAVDFECPFSNIKYTVQNMLRELQETPRGRIFLNAQTTQEICEIWGLENYYSQKQLDFQRQREKLNKLHPSIDLSIEAPEIKRRKIDEMEVVEMPMRFVRGHYTDPSLPKTRLHRWCLKKNVRKPVYQTCQIDKMFYAVLTLDDVKYVSILGEKNKRFAEQSAAKVCLFAHNLMDPQHDKVVVEQAAGESTMITSEHLLNCVLKGNSNASKVWSNGSEVHKQGNSTSENSRL